MFKQLLLSCVIFCLSVNSYSQTPDAVLQLADSLFEENKYTQAFEQYDRLIGEYNQSSQAMLLKMAYIKEGLGQTADALYYLNLSYLRTADRNVLLKMEELAEKEGLNGYEYSDYEFAQTVFFNYFFEINMVLLAFSILIFSIMIYQLKKHQTKPKGWGLTLTLTLVLLFYTLNFGRSYDLALINTSNTYIMDGPSAGAEVIEIVDRGHRVEYANEKDIWVQVNWEGREAYVRKDKLRYIH